MEARLGPGDSPFFRGGASNGRPVVLQHRLGEPVSLAVTGYTKDGTLTMS